MNRIKSIAIIATFLFITVSLVSEIQAQSKNSEPEIGLKIGNKAPELAYYSPDSTLIKLSDLKGQMVLIDFWASWCRPCRIENPNVVKAYNTFKNKKFKNGKGFTIYGVSLDRTKSAWLKAIEQDKLNWDAHVSDLKHWRSEPAKIYQVSGIPTNFLIDGNGIIVAKNLRGQRLDITLESLLENPKR